MASSSRAITSSVSFAGRRPSSSSSYDVFINFRGTDTRTNFVCLLYNALKKDGVNAYRDSEEIWEGEEICGSLLRAIRGSEISIPVFSKNYADSKYCLLELAEMWECHLSDGQTILPVFIDVEPRDVRHQTGSFEKPFQEHQRTCKYADVESWKNALTEVGKLKGWTLMGDATIEDQSHLVELIIQRVLRELSSTPLDECKHPVGMESQVNNLLSLLNIGSEDVQFVAICGMGGLGKTTIAKVIYNRIFRSFNGSSFLTDVREEASQGNKGLVSLQKRLLGDILKRDHDVSNICQGSKLIKNLLHGKKVLLILDDVDDHEQLDVLAGGINWFGQGSKVIITTREDQSLDANKVETYIQIYKLQALDFENSLQLLSVYAFSKNEPPENYKQLSHEIVSHADGLPLTLEVLGSFLFGKDKKEWEETLGGLKDILNNKVSGMSVKSYDDKVFAKLMISYNKLSEHAKIIFLDIACHFIGWKAEEAISLWEACELRPRLLIKELTQKHLLKIDDYGILRMHDQLSYMGRSIVSKDSYGDPTKRTRLWSHDEILEVFQKGTGTQMVEGICRKNFDFAAKEDLSWEDFAKMPNLRFLHFHKSGNLNGDFSHLSSKLRWFRWHYCPLEIISSNFYHEELVHLDLSYSDIKLAWTDIPQNKNKRFQKLKVLILDHCCRLSCSPDSSWFPCLQRLELTDCSSLLELPDSICQMASLKSLILNYCQSLNKLPMSIGDLKQLVMLSMRETMIEELPDGVGQLEKLEDLDFSSCLNLVKLPASMGRMRSLLHFYLPDTMIVNLPDDFSKLTSLEGLRMNVVNLDDLTDYKMRQLLPISMNVFSELPCSLIHLDASHSEWLKVLSFYDCKSWVRSSDLSNLKRSMKLDISKCENLGEIHGLEGAECLKDLTEIGHSKLRKLPELSNLKRLRKLDICYCVNLEEIHGLEVVECLEVLKAIGCNKLREFPELSNLKKLRELDISGCKNLEEIHGLEGTDSLEELTVQDCHKLIGTSRKIQGQGRLVDNVGKSGQGCSSIAADDHDIYQGSPILCVVFAFKPRISKQRKGVARESITFEIEASIPRRRKVTYIHFSITTEEIEVTPRDIIYMHHLNVNGSLFQSKGAIKGLTVRRAEVIWPTSCWEVELKFWKVLFKNEESDEKMLVADFFKWSEADDDKEVEVEVEEEEGALWDRYYIGVCLDEWDDEASPLDLSSCFGSDTDSQVWVEGEEEEMVRQTLDQPSVFVQEKGKTSLSDNTKEEEEWNNTIEEFLKGLESDSVSEEDGAEEEVLRPSKRSRLHYRDDEAAGPSCSPTLRPMEVESNNGFNLQQMLISQRPNIDHSIQGFHSGTEEVERSNKH